MALKKASCEPNVPFAKQHQVKNTEEICEEISQNKDSLYHSKDVLAILFLSEYADTR